METKKNNIFRNSKYVIIKGLVQPIIILVLVFGNNIEESIKLLKELSRGKEQIAPTEILIGMGIMLALMIFFAIRAYFIWKNTFITIDDDRISYQKRSIFIKKYKEASTKNITNVNLQANLFERMFNVKRITIDMDSSQTAKKDDYSIVLNDEKAELFKNYIYEKKYNLQNTTDATDTIYPIDQPTSAYIDPAGQSPSMQDALAPSAYYIPGSSNEFLHKKEFTKNETIKAAFFSYFNTFIFFLLMLIPGFYAMKHGVFSVGILTILFYVIGFIKSLNQILNFSVARAKDSLHISCGLISRSEFVLPIKNIVSLKFCHTIPSRIFGYAEINVETVGLEANNNSNRLVIMMKKSELRKFAEEFVPEFPIYEEADKRPAGAALYTAAITLLIFMPIGLLLRFAIHYTWARYAPYIAFALAAICTLYCQLTIGYRQVEEGIVVRSGIGGCYELLPIDKIEVIREKTNPIYNLTSLASLEVFLRGGQGKRSVSGIVHQKGNFNTLLKYYQAGEK